MAATGMAWDEIAEPYPDFIDAGNGGEYTLAWCIRRTADACIFLRTAVLHLRPPPLDLPDLSVYARGRRPAGLGMPGSRDAPLPGAAHDVALGLCRRQAAEAAEEDGVRAVYRRARVPPGGRVVIDSEGVKVLHD